MPKSVWKMRINAGKLPLSTLPARTGLKIAVFLQVFVKVLAGEAKKVTIKRYTFL